MTPGRVEDDRSLTIRCDGPPTRVVAIPKTLRSDRAYRRRGLADPRAMRVPERHHDSVQRGAAPARPRPDGGADDDEYAFIRASATDGYLFAPWTLSSREDGSLERYQHGAASPPGSE